MATSELELLRLATAGGVDDGKSTLIGRLLHDTRNIHEDQLDALREAALRRGENRLDLSLLTDGLRAEREQRITIDVAYRYFSTPRRRFILADTPGHPQYTRNMVTGASTADVVVVLVDVRRGVREQSRRHGVLAALLGIRRVVVAVNKMDAVGWRPGPFQEVEARYRDFAGRLEIPFLDFIPLSALEGDNVVEASPRMPWYRGPTLLEYLETVELEAPDGDGPFRLHVQGVIRPHQDFRGVAGRVASGRLEVGDEVVVLPAGARARVAELFRAGVAVEGAEAGDAVLMVLDRELDVGRGDLLAGGALPEVSRGLQADLCWMDERPLRRGRSYHLHLGTRRTRARVEAVLHRLEVATLEREPAPSLELNEIGRVRVGLVEPLPLDPFGAVPGGGTFILVDPETHATVAAGMVRQVEGPARVSPDVRWEDPGVGREAREARNGHRAAVVWFTGLPASGKSTLARAVETRLFADGVQVVTLDGDRLRHGLSGDLGFSPEDRRENLRRAGAVARILFDAGVVVLCAFVSPFREDRDRLRALFPPGRFLEVHLEAGPEVCRGRDPKGLYAAAAEGRLTGLTGVDAPWEPPLAPELGIGPQVPVEEAAARVLERLRLEGVL